MKKEYKQSMDNISKTIYPLRILGFYLFAISIVLSQLKLGSDIDYWCSAGIVICLVYPHVIFIRAKYMRAEETKYMVIDMALQGVMIALVNFTPMIALPFLIANSAASLSIGGIKQSIKGIASAILALTIVGLLRNESIVFQADLNELIGPMIYLIVAMHYMGYLAYVRGMTAHSRGIKLISRRKEIEKAVHNKNILFKELYHRVKNNLQIISSLLSMQTKRVGDTKAKIVLEGMTQRIQAMSMVHEKLYQADNLTAICMQDYTQDLVRDLKQGFKRKNLSFSIACEDVSLTLQVAVPMGLIINELVTNAIKYAFDEENKNQKITIKMYTKNNILILMVYDNGKGTKIDKVQNGFGFKLVKSLASYQLKGKINMYNDNGLHHEITFPKGVLE